jgi:uncharacterized membrane-anchored protein YitT (DUF2179 family)
LKQQIDYEGVGKILLGTCCMAVAVNWIYEPSGMVTGGISGFSIVLRQILLTKYSISVPLWVFNFALNVPIFLAAFRVLGRKSMRMTIFANISFTVLLGVIPIRGVFGNDIFLSAVAGGVLTGAGLGLVLGRGYSTGGTDLLSIILHHSFPVYGVGNILFAADSVIILLGAWQFGIVTAIYAVIAVYLTSKVMDAMIEGGRFSKMVYIISDSYKEIGRDLLYRLERGVTVLDGVGMYTGSSRQILLCVVSKKQIVSLREIAFRHDENAFVIISDIREVLGEGFVEKQQL